MVYFLLCQQHFLFVGNDAKKTIFFKAIAKAFNPVFLDLFCFFIPKPWPRD
jgi:hypothetical protein